MTFTTPQTQDVNWIYIRPSEDVLDFFWTSYVRSIYVLCLRGAHYLMKFKYSYLKPFGKIYCLCDCGHDFLMLCIEMEGCNLTQENIGI